MLKYGVRVLGLRPEIVLAILAATKVWEANGADLVVTSAIDGTHKRASKHYTGCAVDLRTRGLADPEKATRALQDALGEDFDVILEGKGTPNEHCHVEFDPKAPY